MFIYFGGGNLLTFGNPRSLSLNLFTQGSALKETVSQVADDVFTFEVFEVVVPRPVDESRGFSALMKVVGLLSYSGIEPTLVGQCRLVTC